MAPDGAETPLDVLRSRAETTPEQAHLLLYDDQDRLSTLSFAELLAGASAVARGLAARGICRGDRVALMLPTGREFFFSFLGTLLEGAIPVPLYPPFRADRIEEYALRQTAILQNADAALITFREVGRLARLLKPKVASLTVVATAEQLAAQEARQAPSRVAHADDVALIQYTSGSTGDPRGVVVTHRALLANMRAIGHGTAVRDDDVVVCWLPLYHDMGLIGCWLFALYYGLPMVTLSPLAFLRRPERWLWAFHRHRGTLSPAPNFAYELCVRKVSDAAIAGLDLSTWRVALNGAEPISAETVERFSARYAPHGFRPEAMMPVYGLAECTVALTFAPAGRAPRIELVDRDAFQKAKRAEPASKDELNPLQFVSVGRALPEHEIRIVDDNDQLLEERLEGHVQFRGASAMQGYYRNPEATSVVRTADGWYRTGDLGYLAEGELYITGRVKDLIIKAGRNIYPQEVELAAGVEGVRRGCVAALRWRASQRHGIAGAGGGNARDGRRRAGAHQRRNHAASERHGARLARCGAAGAAAEHSQDTERKAARSACRELYLRDADAQQPAPAWVQVTRMVAATRWPPCAAC
jgi:acyl-CoA synthetase (AMP-forming)/AMP-acid ligase II